MTPTPRTGFADGYQHALNGDTAAVQNLLDGKKITLDRHLISCAVMSRSTDTLQMLLDHGWDINMPETGKEPPFLGMAVKLQDKELVRWFLENGADPNGPCDLGETPLSRAVWFASLDIIQLLFEYGASAKEGYPMNFACRRDDEDLDVLRLLLKHGADINKRLYEDEKDSFWCTILGTTPLMVACEKQNVTYIRFLIQAGADLSKLGVGQTTALQVAHMVKRQDISEMLRIGIS